MNANFDPRAWNLFAGVALLTAGCGARVASPDEAGDGETADTNPEGSECVDSSDCPVGYGCYDGVCMYYPHHDGWIPYYDCYSDEECDEFYICEFGYCGGLGAPPPDCEDVGASWPVPTTIDVGAGALALTFADVDADGQDELVVAMPTELRVYEYDGAPPTVSAREAGPITDMVAGEFDAAAGEDVLLLLGEALVLHSSNSDGSFAAPLTNPIQLGFVTGLFAGQFDDQPSSDLLAWGGAGAYIDLAGQVSIFDTSQVAAAAVHEFGSPEPGFALRRDTFIDLYTLDAQPLSTWADIGGPPVVAAFDREFESEYVNLLHYSSWSRVQSRNVSEGLSEWSIYGTPEQVFAGDLDGSETDELVFFDDASVSVHYNPSHLQGGGDCWHPVLVPGRGNPIEAVFGDYDGDGDQELAIRTDAQEVAVFDGG